MFEHEQHCCPTLSLAQVTMFSMLCDKLWDFCCNSHKFEARQSPSQVLPLQKGTCLCGVCVLGELCSSLCSQVSAFADASVPQCSAHNAYCNYSQQASNCPCATAGAGAVKANLRALNQSVSSQVALLMKNPTKLARRSGVTTEQRPRVLCQMAQPLAEPAARPMETPAELLQSGFAKDASAAGEEEELDLEAFDDGEFYAQLLKEFLDSSGGATGVSGSALYPQVKFHKHADLGPSVVYRENSKCKFDSQL